MILLGLVSATDRAEFVKSAAEPNSSRHPEPKAKELFC